MAQVFLSYQKRDRVLAERVGATLRAQGISVWWDQEVTPRESWDRILEREIAAATYVLVLWTRYSVESDWVRSEADYARDCKPKKLVQARFDDCQVPIGFRLIQYVDLDRDRPEASEGWASLIRWLGGIGPAEGDAASELAKLRDTNAALAALLDERSAAAPASPAEPAAATQPPPNLPLFYRNLQPLSSSLHARYRARTSDKAPYFATAHAIPLTTDEFIHAQRFMPIVFSTGENSVPLALTGLNDGVNIFVDKDGRSLHPFYVPAYVRRYPYVLARLDENAQELSLCFDPESELIGEFPDGEPLFRDGQPTATLNDILKFCEDFEAAGQRTGHFVRTLEELGLLMDGEVSIQPEDSAQPFIYRGFRMVDEEKFNGIRGSQLTELHQNGVLPLIMAHLFSLQLIRELFARQTDLGK